jgi:hypothetical protein
MSDTDPTVDRFWERLTLAELSADQWEALCDGCGKCCVEKFEDEDTGAIHYTDVACVLLDRHSCRCSDYANRARRVADCVTLTPQALADPRWLPETCAYRRVAERRPLPDWHPLLTGDRELAHRRGHSVRGRVRSPDGIDDPLLYLVDWIR